MRKAYCAGCFAIFDPKLFHSFGEMPTSKVLEGVEGKAHCKMQMQSPLLKNYDEFQEGESRALNQARSCADHMSLELSGERH